MNDIVTVKDQYAAVIEKTLVDLGIAEAAQEIAILMVQQLESQGLMPGITEYRVGSQDDYLEEIHTERPALEDGQYLLTRVVTGWMGGVL